VRKYKIFWSLAAEERWLNQVQAAGFYLTAVNRLLHQYTFQRLSNKASFQPKICLDFQKPLSWRCYQDYCQLFADSGWNLIQGSRFGGIQYFQQSYQAADQEIFSDEQSRQANWRRDHEYARRYSIIFLSEAILFRVTHASATGLNLTFDFRQWYLTPGIWHLQGFSFWKAFLIETPFVAFRNLSMYLFLIIGLYYLVRSLYNGGKFAKL
jgi:Protein of unknown function (DUF2812).